MFLAQDHATELFEAAPKRVSVRSYASTYPDAAVLDQIDAFIATLNTTATPLNIPVKLCLMREDFSMLYTFGFIGGCKYWLCGSTSKTIPFAKTAYGYLFEFLVLECTRLGLSTCWLGGSFTTSCYTAALEFNAETEVIPCVSPVGLSAGGESWLGKVMGSRTRKPWSELFFTAEGALTEEDLVGTPFTREMLEGVRWAPSARNAQEWRLVVDKTTLHVFAVPTGFSGVDAGIAMAHVELGCAAAGVRGSWQSVDVKLPVAGEWDYVLSFVCE